MIGNWIERVWSEKFTWYSPSSSKSAYCSSLSIWWSIILLTLKKSNWNSSPTILIFKAYPSFCLYFCCYYLLCLRILYTSSEPKGDLLINALLKLDYGSKILYIPNCVWFWYSLLANIKGMSICAFSPIFKKTDA